MVHFVKSITIFSNVDQNVPIPGAIKTSKVLEV